jgi:uncharacterized membrane protein (DUF2068 family)
MVRLGKVSGSSFFSVFYFITGIVLLVTLVQSTSPPVHVALLGALSLIASYGLNRMKRWAFFLTALIALPNISFGCITIYAIYRILVLGSTETLLLLATNLYVILSALSLIHVIQKRDKFRSKGKL